MTVKQLSEALNLLIAQGPAIKAAGGRIEVDAIKAMAKERGVSQLLVDKLEQVAQVNA